MSGVEVWTVVMGLRVVEIEMEVDDRPRSVGLSVRVDGVKRWSSEEPGWREIGCGADGDMFIWSARRLVIVPLEADGNAQAIDSDEDIVVAFGLDGRWLLVCESSLRLVSDSAVEWSRLEMPDVVTDARWKEGRLSVYCDDESRFDVIVVGDGLEIAPTA
jgi:hypothetical protein